MIKCFNYLLKEVCCYLPVCLSISLTISLSSNLIIEKLATMFLSYFLSSVENLGMSLLTDY